MIRLLIIGFCVMMLSSVVANTHDPRNTCANVRELYRENSCCQNTSNVIASEDIATKLIGPEADFALRVRNLNVVNGSHMSFDAMKTMTVMLERPYFGGMKINTTDFISSFATGFSQSTGGGPTTIINNHTDDDLSNFVVKITGMSLDATDCGDLCDTLKVWASYESTDCAAPGAPSNCTQGTQVQESLRIRQGTTAAKADLFIDSVRYRYRYVANSVYNSDIDSLIGGF